MCKNRFYMLLMGVLFLNISFCSVMFAVKIDKDSTFYDVKEAIASGQYEYAVFDISQSFIDCNIEKLANFYVDEMTGFKAIAIRAGRGVKNLFSNKKYKDIDVVKEFNSFLKTCVADYKCSYIEEICKKVWDKHCEHQVFKNAVEIFNLCKKHKVKTIFAEVGIAFFFKDFLNTYKFDKICATKIEFKDKKATGKLLGKPCSGKPKRDMVVAAIKEMDKEKNKNNANLKKALKKTIFFPNSPNDKWLAKELGTVVVVNKVSDDDIDGLIEKNGWADLRYYGKG